MRSPRQRLVAVPAVFLLLVLAACIPLKNQTIETIGPAPKEPLNIPIGTKLAPVTLDRIGYKIRRGKAISDRDGGTVTECSYSGPTHTKLFWDQGRIMGKDIELSDIFFEELNRANYNVVGDPKKMFGGVTRDKIGPSYLVGASIEKLNVKICDRFDVWSARHLLWRRMTVEIRVKWQVFSVHSEKVVHETETTGAVKLTTPQPDVLSVAINEAFANAAANFAHDRGFFDLVSRPALALADIRSVKDTKLLIKRENLLTESITKNIDVIRLGVVTLDTGLGHGSGFFISPRLVLTNHHVVEGRSIVRVTLVTGRNILGEVIRKHPERDVALVQVEEGGYRPLAIRTTPLKITEDVYAVGTPGVKERAGTVSKGIVSKFQRNENGLEDIQADVDVHGGSSGGVLLDGRGNVVGVTYAGKFADSKKLSIGINFFIPIGDALRFLNIKFKDEDRQQTGS